MEAPTRPRILVVEDDPRQLDLFQRLLKLQFDVVGTDSPENALGLLQRERFDVVLSDYMMPEMTGVELLTRARKVKPEVPRVLMSAYADAADALHAIDSGNVHRFIEKPVSADELRRWLVSFTPHAEPIRCVVISPDRLRAKQVLDELSSAPELAVTHAEALGAAVQAELIVFLEPESPIAVEQALTRLGRARPQAAAMVALPAEQVNDAAGYLSVGVDDLLWLPLRLREALLRFHTWRAKREAAREADRVRAQVISQEPFPQIVGRSKSMRRVFEQVHRVAPTDASVLITGETGTGKEMIARALHALSRRRDAQFLAANLSAMPETLVESELFGYDKGAFTGAQGMRKGRIETVEGGTLFLDEIGDLSPAIQVKLLRVLEQRTYERLGSTMARAADFRLVCATHRNLADLIAEGKFREDLYYRINVVHIHLPPLRERGDDIRLLAEHCLDRFKRDFGLNRLDLTDTAIQALLRHHWPGNVRELQHLIQRACAMAQDGGVIDEGDIVWQRQPRAQFNKDVESFLESGRSLREVLADIERQILLETLQRFGANQVAAAKKLGIPRQTLQNRLRKYGLL